MSEAALPMDAAATACAEIASAVARLSAADARTEWLAELRIPRGFGPLRRAPRFVPIARVWRLGVVLLTAESAETARLFAVGAVTRAREPRHPNFTSVSAEERREAREAALRSGFSVGDTVDYDATALPLDDTLGSIGPIVMRDGELLVSWNATRSPESLVPFASYLAERVGLLVDPPAGA